MNEKAKRAKEIRLSLTKDERRGIQKDDDPRQAFLSVALRTIDEKVRNPGERSACREYVEKNQDTLFDRAMKAGEVVVPLALSLAA